MIEVQEYTVDEILESLNDLKVDLINLQCNPLTNVEQKLAEILDELTDSVQDIARAVKELQDNG